MVVGFLLRAMAFDLSPLLLVLFEKLRCSDLVIVEVRI